MKKSNYFILSVLLVSILCILCYVSISKLVFHIFSLNADNGVQVQNNSNNDNVIKPQNIEENKNVIPINVDLKTTLFIGDSRTVGLMDYGKMDEANFFCNVGMSVFNIYDKVVSVPNVGKVSLNDLLDAKDYQTIYVMLGLNEMGYEFEEIVDKYHELIDFIKNKEANAHIIILGNLHVTKERSNSDEIFNNDNINRLNDTISKFADNKHVFYLDTNILFDVEGALDSEKSSDSTHLYGKYYDMWGDWIVQESRKLKGE